MEYIEFPFIGGYIIAGVLIPLISNVVVWFLIIKVIINAFKRNKNHNYFKNNVIKNQSYETNVSRTNNKYKRIYKDVSKEVLSTFNTDNINTLKDFFYSKFLEFEISYNNLDYNIMRVLSTKQLFQNYYTGITLDLKAGKKRIISDIVRKNVIVFELDSTIAKQTACVMIEIEYLNYTIDKNGYVIRGSRDNKIKERFEVTFRKDFEMSKDYIKCPNCGATIVGNKCNYCRTPIRNEEFKISSIKKIIDEP